MSEEARSRRASALEEKKRRLEELKARRAATVASSLNTPSNPEFKLDDYIDDLLSTKAPGAAPVVEQQQQEAAPNVDAEDKQQVATSSNGMIAAAQLEVKPRVETFSISTQTEDKDFPCESSILVLPGGDEEKENITSPSLETIPATTSTVDDEAAADVVQHQVILSREDREVTLASESFSSFFTAATKKVERLLGAPILADLLVDANYAGRPYAEEEADEDDNDDENSNRVVKNKWLATGAHARVTMECPLWTKTRTIHDMYWSPIHKELILATYDSPQSSSHTTITPSMLESNTAAATNNLLMSTNNINCINNTPSDVLASRNYEHLADGIALLWSLAMPNRPEHVLISNSPILAARFHPTEPHLIIGGCYSGQLMLWDLRAGRLPIQKSTLAITSADRNVTTWKGHAHPICSLEVVEGGTGLVTASTDGKINFWSLTNLRDPAEFYMVDGHVSCLAVAPESNSILCGDESGGMHSIIVPQSAAAVGPTTTTAATPTRTVLKSASSLTSSSSSTRRIARKLDASGTISSHFGMVTSISTKYVPPTSNAASSSSSSSSKYMSRGFLRGSAGLVLTSGVDWTCKLWAPAYQDKPLLSFTSSSYDYMCDAQWNPSNPTVFAAASSNGVLDFWNLAHSLDEPISGSTGISVSDPRTQAVNKLKWSYDGRRLGIAVSDQLQILGVSEELWRGKAEDEPRMMHHLTTRGLLEGQL